MKYNICSVVVGKTIEEFLNNLNEVQNVSDFVELRVDYIKNFSIDFLEILKKNTIKKNIFTCRSILEGGKFKGPIEDLKKIIYKANEIGFEHIDIEKSLLNQITFNKKNSFIIGSYHNFNETPNYNELLNIYKEISYFKYVDFIKIATNVLSSEDNINLIKILIENKNSIIIGMGEKGKIIRIISPLFGSYLTFASVDKNVSAPGQISLDELKKIYKKYEWE